MTSSAIRLIEGIAAKVRSSGQGGDHRDSAQLASIVGIADDTICPKMGRSIENADP